MYDKLIIENVEEKIQKIYSINATFTFTDEDLRDPALKGFYQALKKNTQEEVSVKQPHGHQVG
jgi:hypothetical protein